MKSFPTLSALLVGATTTLVLFSPLSAFALSPKAIEQIARSVTVQIAGTEPGSGVIIKHQENTYTILSAEHVVHTEDSYEVITVDGQKHPVDHKTIQKFPEGVDLAILQFNSSLNYQVIELGDSTTAVTGTPCYVSGFPKIPGANRTHYQFSEGQIEAHASRALASGYALAYFNHTFAGMSGGPVLNAKGQLIGIHGQALSGFRKTKGIDPETGIKFSLNLAIPLNRFLQLVAQVAPSLSLKGAKAERLSSQVTADDLLVQSYGKSIQGDLRGALEDDNHAVKLSPRNSYAYFSRGLTRYSLGDRQGAIADYSQVLKLNPNLADAYNNRGIAYSDLGDMRSAIADYEKVIKLNPNDDKVYFNRGIVRSDLGDTQGAIADYSTAIRLNPNLANAFINRGTARRKLGDRQGAIADYDQAIRINPNDSYPYYNRGISRSDLGDEKRAIADYDRAIQISPSNAEVYGNRGIARYKVGDKIGALRDLQKAADLFKNQGKDKDYQKAMQIFQKLGG